MNYLDRPVFDFDIDWTRLPSARFEYDLRTLEIGFGPPEFAPLQEHVVHGFQFEALMEDPDAIAAVESFFDAVKGRLQGFWLPGPQEAFRIVAFVGITAETTEFDIAAQGFSGTFGDHPATHVYLTKPGQTPIAAEILAVADNADGTERVTVEVSTLIDETWRAWPLHYVRQAQDNEQGRFEAEGVLVYSMRVVELPTEYALAETGQRPVFLYHIWSDFNGTVQHWHFTSHPLDIEIAAQEYVAKRITHSALSLSSKADREEVSIETLYEPDNPLSLLFPIKLSTPLWVEILEGNLSSESAPTPIFRGLALAASVQGRKETVRCASAMDSMRANVPGIMLQPRCNYRLYEPNTCRVDPDLHKFAVSLVSATGRNVVLSGAGLAGLPAHYFAEGWVQFGTGSTYEVRTILGSTAEAGGEVTLTLNAALSFAAATDAGTLYPGCDGTDGTCLLKFSNFANWGGHRIPLRNLALKAMEIKSGGGGKK
jgi:Phage conserved hypothetical protein BR0599